MLSPFSLPRLPLFFPKTNLFSSPLGGRNWRRNTPVSASVVPFFSLETGRNTKTEKKSTSKTTRERESKRDGPKRKQKQKNNKTRSRENLHYIFTPKRREEPPRIRAASWCVILTTARSGEKTAAARKREKREEEVEGKRGQGRNCRHTKKTQKKSLSEPLFFFFFSSSPASWLLSPFRRDLARHGWHRQRGALKRSLAERACGRRSE